MNSAYFLAIVLAYILIAGFAAAAHFMPQKVVKAIMIAVFAAMLVWEVLKQISAATAEGGYNLWNAPLHFSSTFYISVGLSLLGNKALKRIGQPALFAGGIFLVVIMAYTPKSIFGAPPAEIFNSAECTHSYFFHMAVVLQCAVMLSCGWYKPKLYDPAIFAAFVFVYCCIAVPVSLNTGLNFAGIVTSYIPLLESLRQACGQTIYIIVYYICVCAVGAALIFAYYFICKLCRKRRPAVKTGSNKNSKR